MPEGSDFLEGDAPAADKVATFLTRALEVTGSEAPTTAGALVPWICDALLSNHSIKAYVRGFMDFVGHMQAQGIDPRAVTADHIKLYKRALAEAGMISATVARRLSVLGGAYRQLAAKGLVSWETAQDIAAVKAAGVQKNSTPCLTQRQAIALLEAIPTDSLQGLRDLALISAFSLTGCRISAAIAAPAPERGVAASRASHLVGAIPRQGRPEAGRPQTRVARVGGVPSSASRRERGGPARSVCTPTRLPCAERAPGGRTARTAMIDGLRGPVPRCVHYSRMAT